jgi:GNAT superfamily N-acetyltransferase
MIINMNEYLVKPIKDEEILKFYSILVACGKSMYEKYGLTHWHPFIDLSSFLKSIEIKEIYGVYQNNIPVATFNLSYEPRDYYQNVYWLNSNEQALYLGQLGIDPSLQGQGLGKWCMKAIEKITLAKGIKTLRFDALNAHPWLKQFYINLGYMPLEIVKPKNWELMCFEKYIQLV